MKAESLQAKIALVTGSTRGIGEEIAHGLAREGANVVVTGRNVEDGARVVAAIRSEGGRAEFVAVDLASEDSIAACVTKTVALFGGLDVLVNNAAPTEFIAGQEGGDASVTELTTEGWRKVMTVGMDGLFWMLRAAIPEMKKSGGGSIVNISSVASIQGRGGYDGYTAIKGAMNSLTRSIAVNYGPDNIRCNCLVVGPVLTPGAAASLDQAPTLRQAIADTLLTSDIATPDAISGPVVFFASDASYYITGQQLTVDGGMSIKMPIPKLDG